MNWAIDQERGNKYPDDQKKKSQQCAGTLLCKHTLSNPHSDSPTIGIVQPPGSWHFSLLFQPHDGRPFAALPLREYIKISFSLSQPPMLSTTHWLEWGLPPACLDTASTPPSQGLWPAAGLLTLSVSLLLSFSLALILCHIMAHSDRQGQL